MANTLKNLIISIIGSVLFILNTSSLPAHAASLYLAPASGTVAVGTEFTVVAKLDTSGVPANAVDTSVTFPADKLQVRSISTAGSALSLWVSGPSFNNSNGTITLTGGQPRPGFNGPSVTLATITFMPVATGSATVQATGNSVLSGDGLGTELLTGLGSATFTINTAALPATPTTTTPPNVGGTPVTAPPAPTVNPLVCPPLDAVPEPITEEPLPEPTPAPTPQIDCPTASIASTTSEQAVIRPMGILHGLIMPLLSVFFALLWKVSQYSKIIKP